MVKGKELNRVFTADMISSPGEPQLPCPRIGSETASCCSLDAQRSSRTASALSEDGKARLRSEKKTGNLRIVILNATTATTSGFLSEEQLAI